MRWIARAVLVLYIVSGALHGQEPAPAPEAAPPAPAEPAPQPESAPAEPPAPAPAEPAPQPEPAPAPAEPPAPEAVAQKTFERVFGAAAVFDAVFSAQVLKGEPGKRHYVDANVDGKPEEVWFVDTSPRHPEAIRPVLVRVIDEDGDLVEGQEPDQDNDLYLADWKGDGTVDAVIDFSDQDGDQDVGELAFYRPGGDLAGGDNNVMTVWLSRDIGDDNQLWYDVGYAYDQAACQWRCHFGGNEMHYAMVLAPDATEWKPVFENPFVFVTYDGDVTSEEALRYEVDTGRILTLRQSMDADNDATTDEQHDYDVSIAARAPKDGLAIPDGSTETLQLRGIPTAPVITFAAAQSLHTQLVWDAMLLTWDENDDNVEGVEYADRHERWEGVVAPAVDGFDPIPGVHCGALNKRFELATQIGKPTAVYFHPADHRIHLLGAKRAWMDVDANYDRTPDMKYIMSDTDGDGAIDTWSIDVDANGTEDDSWKATAAIRPIAWTWQEVNAVQATEVAAMPAVLFSLNQRLEQAIAAKGADPFAGSVVAQFVHNGLRADNFDAAITSKLVASNESLRYYFDILKDVYLAQLKKLHDNAPFWQGVGEARGQGDYAKIQALFEQEFALSAPVAAYAEWIAARSAEANPNPRVSTAIDWIPDNIGWESEVAAYRAYWGQIDFFGKNVRRLTLADAAIETANQIPAPWGVDALAVRDTSGLGGVTLYVNEQPFAVRSPGGNGVVKFEKSLVEQDNHRAVVEMKASNVGPIGNTYTVRLRFSIEAGHRESAVEVLVEGAENNDLLELGIGLTRLSHQEYLLDPQAGVMAVWGTQTPAIGRIGLGAVFPAERFVREGDVPGENHIVLKIERGVPITYFIQAKWQNGLQYPVAPVMENWVKELRVLAGAKFPK
ncbi:MAG: DUF4861 family protein [Candidatus Hydrogenedentes bacterium]|nr:DUF4861 family protein [Candidatus Hydrogenedentota bacterium]